ncbi:MAG: thiamine pyrophosphate-binding protein [Gammaproteobacteria bacterium]|nr:thiamine pyrophosphate-binding protein [Gammaproteobacteria bacterium]
MSHPVRAFLDNRLSRRELARRLIAAGLSTAAVRSMVAMAAEARPEALARTEGREFTGTGAQILLETLLAADIDYLFVATSTGMTSLFDAITLRPGLRLILALQEGQATSMAHGYELATGRTSAVLVPGVGIPNAMNNLYNAWKDRSSIAIFSDGPSLEFRGRDGFQQMDDWLAPMETFTKWAWEIDAPGRIAEMTRRAIKMANTAPGGPVHVRFPSNMLAARDVTDTIYPQSLFRVNTALPPRPELVEQAARALIEAEYPFLHVGHEVSRSGANEDVLRLADLIGAPVSQGISCYGDMAFNHPAFAGFYGMGFPRGLARADVFLNLGGQMPSPASVTAPVPRKARVIHARMEFEEIGNHQPTDLAIAGGTGETVAALIEAIQSMATAERLESIAAPRREALAVAFRQRRERQRAAAAENWNASPMSWERACHELDQGLARDAVVVSETNSRIPYELMDFRPGGKRLIGQTTGFALGWAVGAAFGVKIAMPDRQVVAFAGDGAFLFGQAEALWTAVRCEIPVTIVVFNNESYDGERERIFAFSPLASSRETRGLWRDQTCYLGAPSVDFVALAKSFGMEGARADNPAQLRKALQRASAVTREGGPFLLDLRLMQKGYGANDNWYPKVSIADGRTIRV